MKKVILTLSLMALLSGCGSIAGNNKLGNMVKHQGPHQKQMIYHVNPMPNLMQVVLKHGDQLELTGEQQAALKKWRDANHQPMKQVRHGIIAQENKLREMALGEATETELLAQYQKIADLRNQIATTKIKCRSMMQSVLSESQFQQLQQIYSDRMLAKHS